MVPRKKATTAMKSTKKVDKILKGEAGSSPGPGCSQTVSINLPRRATHPLFGEIYAVYAKDKSYCVYRPDESSSKKTLLVECSGTKFSRHDRALRDVMMRSCKKGLDKAATVKFRDSILNA